jgi:hypothetical protein
MADRSTFEEMKHATIRIPFDELCEARAMPDDFRSGGVLAGLAEPGRILIADIPAGFMLERGHL